MIFWFYYREYFQHNYTAVSDIMVGQEIPE